VSALERIANVAARIRAGGTPDFLNRWLTMTPEKLAEHEAAILRQINRRNEPMSTPGPKEQALRAARTETTTPPATAAMKSAGKTAEPKESGVKKAAQAKQTLKKAAPAPKSAKPKKATAKSAQTNARTPVVARPDGLRLGSKLAKLLDAAVAAGPEGSTEKDLCKKIGGWEACAATLRRVCARVGATCERKDGKFVVTLPKAKA